MYRLTLFSSRNTVWMLLLIIFLYNILSGSNKYSSVTASHIIISIPLLKYCKIYQNNKEHTGQHWSQEKCWTRDLDYWTQRRLSENCQKWEEQSQDFKKNNRNQECHDLGHNLFLDKRHWSCLSRLMRFGVSPSSHVRCPTGQRWPIFFSILLYIHCRKIGVYHVEHVDNFPVQGFRYEDNVLSETML